MLTVIPTINKIKVSVSQHRVDSRFIVKVADFGMAKILTSSDEFYMAKSDAQPLPVKWLALECLVEGKFSSKSDVVRRL